MNIYTQTFALVWIISGILSYGIGFAYSQRHYPSVAKEEYKHDLIYALLVGLVFGPVGLVMELLLKQYKHGLKFW